MNHRHTSTVAVTSCQRCPFHAIDRDMGARIEHCTHPNGPVLADAVLGSDANVPPTWCQLRRGLTVVRLDDPLT